MKSSEKEIIKNIHFLAFGEEGKETSELAEAFLAEPDTISISVEREGKMVGNVLFTPFVFEEHPEKKCYLLAPIGVLPEYQRGFGVGRELMQAGIEQLRSMGTEAIFVLGVPTYYPQYGFTPTDKQTPYPDLLTIPESWMALELNEGVLNVLAGKAYANKPFMNPMFWDTSGRG